MSSLEAIIYCVSFINAACLFELYLKRNPKYELCMKIWRNDTAVDDHKKRKNI